MQQKIKSVIFVYQWNCLNPLSPVVLYGSSCWTMWADTERLLRTITSRMLRLVVGMRRRPNETWVNYTQRATWRSKELAANYNLTNWNDLQRKRKQQMVQRVQTMHSDRWPTRVLEWTPWFRTNTTRNESRPKKRWNDSQNLEILAQPFVYFRIHVMNWHAQVQREMRMGVSSLWGKKSCLSLNFFEKKKKTFTSLVKNNFSHPFNKQTCPFSPP